VPWKRWQSRQELKPLRKLRIACVARVAVTGRCLPCLLLSSGRSCHASEISRVCDGSGNLQWRTCQTRDVIVWRALRRCKQTPSTHCSARKVFARCRSAALRGGLLRYLIDRSGKGARSRHSWKFHPHIPPQLLNTGLITLAPSPKRWRSSTDETPHGAGALSFESLQD
jgi:hypothetical protein